MNPVTILGEKLLREELDRLVREKRPRIIQDIATARAHGDLRENAEYHAAREEQGMVESRIGTLQSRLGNLRVIDITAIPHNGRVIFGATVTLLTVKDPGATKETKEAGKGQKAAKESITYQIVGEDEANIQNKKLSYAAPLARVLIGKNEGEVVTLTKPSGETAYYRIEKVEHI